MLIGSHLDSVVQGGNFDGAAGVIAGLAAIAALQAGGHPATRQHRGAGPALGRRAVWFWASGWIGSRSLLARLPAGALDLPHARTGRTLGQSIARTAAASPARLAPGTRCATRSGSGALSRGAYRAGAAGLIEAGGSRWRSAGQPRQYPPPAHPHHRRGCPYRPAAPLPPRCRAGRGGAGPRPGTALAGGGPRRPADGRDDRPFPSPTSVLGARNNPR